MPLDYPKLPDVPPQMLEGAGFAQVEFERLQASLATGALDPASNRLPEGSVQAPRPDQILQWPPDNALEAHGTAALERGEVALCVLNGGMATRFGGEVKSLVEVCPGHTFLSVRLRQVAQYPRVPVFLLSSFATHQPTLDYLQTNQTFGLDASRVQSLVQRVSYRLTSSGDFLLDSAGDGSPCAPGHGDVFEVLAESAGFRDFVANGGKAVMIANIDNLGATLHPSLVASHMAAPQAVTVEVAPKFPGDAGGAPASVDGRLQIVEGFRFPTDFDQSAIPVFNTNTLWLDTAAIRADYPLTWFRVDKQVDGRPCVQFERLMGEVTAFVEARFQRVPRDDAQSRFLPVKTRDDLAAMRQQLERIANA